MDMPFIWLYQILLCVARLQSQSLNENDCQPFGWNMQTWVQCLRITCFLYGKFGFDFMLHWIVLWSFQHFHIREINSSCFYNVWAMTAFLLWSTWILSWLYYFVWYTKQQTIFKFIFARIWQWNMTILLLLW